MPQRAAHGARGDRRGARPRRPRRRRDRVVRRGRHARRPGLGRRDACSRTAATIDGRGASGGGLARGVPDRRRARLVRRRLALAPARVRSTASSAGRACAAAAATPSTSPTATRSTSGGSPASRPGTRLELRAEMKLPGEAQLSFEIEPRRGGSRPLPARADRALPPSRSASGSCTGRRPAAARDRLPRHAARHPTRGGGGRLRPAATAQRSRPRPKPGARPRPSTTFSTVASSSTVASPSA